MWLSVLLLAVLAACTTSSGGEQTTSATTGPAASTTVSTDPPLILGPGIEEGLIRLGAILPLSGSREALGRSVLAGHEAYWGYVNTELGGVEGFVVEVVAHDGLYQPDASAAAAESLADLTLAFSAGLGSPITEAILPLAEREELLMATGAQISVWGAEPALLLDLAIAAYPDQVGLGLLWLEQSEVAAPGATVGLIHQEGLYGEDCRAGFESALADSTFSSGPVLDHTLAQSEFTDVVTTQQAGGVEVLVLCTVPEAMLAILATAELMGYAPTVLATSQSYDPALPASLGGDAGEQAGLSRLQSLYVTGAVEAEDETSPGFLLYQDNLSRSGLEPREETWYTFWGYTQAATMHLVLEEAFAGRDVSRSGLRAAVGRVGQVDLGFGAGPVEFDEAGVPTPVDAVGRPVAAGERMFGLERVSDFIRLKG